MDSGTKKIVITAIAATIATPLLFPETIASTASAYLLESIIYLAALWFIFLGVGLLTHADPLPSILESNHLVRGLTALPKKFIAFTMIALSTLYGWYATTAYSAANTEQELVLAILSTVITLFQYFEIYAVFWGIARSFTIYRVVKTEKDVPFLRLSETIYTYTKKLGIASTFDTRVAPLLEKICVLCNQNATGFAIMFFLSLLVCGGTLLSYVNNTLLNIEYQLWLQLHS